jgi:hypothetical protein
MNELGYTSLKLPFIVALPVSVRAGSVVSSRFSKNGMNGRRNCQSLQCKADVAKYMMKTNDVIA